MFRHLIALVLLTTLFLSVNGCGASVPSLIEISGVLSLDGKPLDEVRIQFFPDPEEGNVGSGSTAVTDASGNFTMRYTNADVSELGVKPGWVRVTLNDTKVENSREERLKPRFSKEYVLAASTPIRLNLTEPTSNLKLEINDYPIDDSKSTDNR